jgi:hypothetical protein
VGIKAKLSRVINRIRRHAANKDQRRRLVLQEIYQAGLWGKDKHFRFFSGIGSRGDAADSYVENMSDLIRRHSTELGYSPAIIDLGCGDFQVGSALVSRLADVTYIGRDIVPELVAYNSQRFATDRISFRNLDIVVDPLPAGDICLVRQVLQHLSNEEIASILQRLAHYKFVFVTEGYPAQRVGPVNPDKAAGADVRFDWRTGRGQGVELDQPPFNARVAELFRAFAPRTRSSSAIGYFLKVRRSRWPDRLLGPNRIA